MTLIKEITDGIALVAEAIENIREIQTAIKDGKKYLEKKHPEIKQDVAAMCEEMRKTCDAIAKASAVITNFHFNGSPGAMDKEPTRFNKYFIKFKSNRNAAENLIMDLKGSCRKIHDHMARISGDNPNAFWSFFGLQSAERNAELAQMLQKIYDDEMDLHKTVKSMSQAMNDAIEDVTNVLTENAMLSSKKVPEASTRLKIYSAEFKLLEASATKTRDAMEAMIVDLG